MGWCSGTHIFDAFCDVLFDPKTKSVHEILVSLIAELEEMDWDCQGDSKYWNTPVVREAFKELHPDWDYEEEE